MFRRTFVLNALAIAALKPRAETLGKAPNGPAISTLAPSVRLPPEEATVELEEADAEGCYLACSLDQQGRISIHWLMNHRAVDRQIFESDQLTELAAYINDVGLSRVRFIDWHAVRECDIDVTVRQLEP